eukprot:scaffold8008_cov34-Tisochrysis_lutea.AAC.4
MYKSAHGTQVWACAPSVQGRWRGQPVPIYGGRSAVREDGRRAYASPSCDGNIAWAAYSWP